MMTLIELIKLLVGIIFYGMVRIIILTIRFISGVTRIIMKTLEAMAEAIEKEVKHG